jgi:flagellar hook-associated protein 1 FlgK
MMTLDTSLSIALTGLRASSAGLRTVANNVANAETPGYTRKTQPTLATVPDETGMGVQLADLQRNVDAALQREVFARGAAVTGLEAREALLSGIDTVHGRPEAGDSLAGLTGRLTQAFNTLAADPSQPTAQQEVVRAAQAIVRKLNDLSGAVTEARNRAHEQIVGSARTTNDQLAQIDRLTIQIKNAIASGRQVPDLEDRRDAALEQFVAETGARFLIRQDGSVLLTGPNGTTWPTEKARGAAEGPLTVATAELSANGFHDAAGGPVPGVILTDPGIATAPRDITRDLTAGRLGALVTLRDATLPTMQAELDEFAHALARRFDQQGLRLFSDGFGNVPEEGLAVRQSPYVGFAASIQVFAPVEADVRLVRDGTHSIPGGLPPAPATRPTGNPQGSLFTPNAAGGPAGFDGLARRIIEYALGRELQPGVPHDPALANTGLGPRGTLGSDIPPHATLADHAASLVAAQTGARARTTEAREAEGASRDLVRNKLADEAGVNVDEEMSLMVQLQNAYQASARVLQTNRELWDALYQATR